MLLHGSTTHFISVYTILKTKPTNFLTDQVPTMFINELAELKKMKIDLSSLRTGIMAGSICPEQVMRNVMEKMHMTDVTIA
jgi:acyl-CoA synthetase (AMP-forming)/AMP-acid ligase II